MEIKHTNNSIKICVMGASFDTGNLGVNALAESTIKIILHRWPDAQIVFLGSGYKPYQQYLSLAGRKICVETLPVRFSKNIFLPYHFLRFTLYGLLAKMLPSTWTNNILLSRNPYFKTLYETDLVVDITGGDGFSDIYGMHRFIVGSLQKCLVILLGKKLIMLPQTYGPFNSSIAKVLAIYILKRTTAIYARDRASVNYVYDLLKNHTSDRNVQCLPDVAFALDSREPKHIDMDLLANFRTKNATVVGLNISGLLYNGGYTRNNMFGLKTDYQQLIYKIIELLLKRDNVIVLLVPHMLPGHGVESDHDACSKVFQETGEKYKGRIFLVKGQYDHNEIKYIIGLCDFFIGSRMHACISALSQGIPAVGLAYSKKFWGVFESVGAENLVIDLRQHEENEIFAAISDAFENRVAIAETLRSTVPDVQAKVLSIFKDFQ